MDLQAFVDCVEKPCCVMSVEKTPEGRCGDIRIVAANEAYRQIMGPGYHEGMLYHELVPKEIKFEDMVFRCAFGKERLHAYVPTEGIHNTWTDQVHIPLKQANEHLGYTQFMFDFTKDVETDRMAAVSAQTAETVIRNSLTMLTAERFHDGLQAVMGDILNSTHADRCRVILIDRERRQAINFCEETADPSGRYVNIPYSIVENWERTIGVSDGILVKDEGDMCRLEEVDPIWVAHMRKCDIESVILFPMKNDKETIGYLYVVNYDVEKAVEHKAMLQLMAFILGTEVAAYQLREKLERMSRTDELTGLQNRNAMRTLLKEIPGDYDCWPLGVVNMDLNGLKEVNDKFGHEAGDRMICHAADVMRRVFSQKELYRVGGDEFIAVVTGVGKEAFDLRLKELNEFRCNDPNFNMAIGYSWEETPRTDLERVFEYADKRMYENKRAYYRLHPEKDRRHMRIR